MEWSKFLNSNPFGESLAQVQGQLKGTSVARQATNNSTSKKDTDNKGSVNSGNKKISVETKNSVELLEYCLSSLGTCTSQAVVQLKCVCV